MLTAAMKVQDALARSRERTTKPLESEVDGGKGWRTDEIRHSALDEMPQGTADARPPVRPVSLGTHKRKANWLLGYTPPSAVSAVVS